ncbi:MAG TPA: hypothetical protein ENJ20_06565 [Bacteroidetes bacterium]|nr:hypothetical protein [Bacteroidota bacterium]
MTVAEFYGGDGGQILTGSYLLDYDGDADKDLVRLEMEHWIDASTDPPVDKTNTHAALLLWDGRQFVQSPVADTADLIKRFPLNDFFSRQ